MQTDKYLMRNLIYTVYFTNSYFANFTVFISHVYFRYLYSYRMNYFSVVVIPHLLGKFDSYRAQKLRTEKKIFYPPFYRYPLKLN